MVRHFLLSAVLLLTVYGQLIIKARAMVHASAAQTGGRVAYLVEMFTDLFVLSGLGAAVVAGAFWMLAIERTELGYAYPFMALSFVFVPIASAVLFGERLPPLQLLGLLLIVVGVGISALAR
jgi:drug/metabolite transporter (DMT)-like permease